MLLSVPALPNVQIQAKLAALRPATHEPPLLVAIDADVYFLFGGQPGFEAVPFYGLRSEQISEADLIVFKYQGDADPLKITRPHWARQLNLEPVYLPDEPPPWLTLFGRDVTNGPDSRTVSIYRPHKAEE